MKFKANVHISSLDGENLPLWNTNTNSFIDVHMTNNILETEANDKHEARAIFYKMIRKLQSKVIFQKGMTRKEGDEAMFYINQIWQSKTTKG